MSRILVTGGTVFVSKFIAEYFVRKKHEVFVLNRNTRPQIPLVKLIQADRNSLSKTLFQGLHFDLIIDVAAYTELDVKNLLDALESAGQYVFISSSAVYPETGTQPFAENAAVAPNKFWGSYGTNKIQAEKYLLSQKADAYILRPPYLYGRYNNVYREAFVFECAEKERTFYLPQDGKMLLQFFHVEDLCKMIEKIAETKPEQRIFNVGNEEAISVLDWVRLCYKIVGKELVTKNVLASAGGEEPVEQRNYFCFYDYEYRLDVTRQKSLLGKTLDLETGLKDSYDWYKNNRDKVSRKNYIEFIDKNFSVI